MKAASIAALASLGLVDGLLIVAPAFKPIFAPVLRSGAALRMNDEPERSERTALNIAQTTYASTMKSPKVRNATRLPMRGCP